jgi:alkanesulfonate monooxygenase SsuD/methylene tetrahydromethanopterin reductase-like flavin-dependent oxidoreductase (luciferase family)
MLAQVDAFQRGKAELDAAGRALTLSLSRVAFVARDRADREAKIRAAQDYYRRFDNVFTGPGIVEGGMIVPLPRKQSMEELAESLLICTPAEMLDKLGPYAVAGVDRVILNVNFGAGQAETLECLQCFAEEVMPHFTRHAGRRKTVEAAE